MSHTKLLASNSLPAYFWGVCGQVWDILYMFIYKISLLGSSFIENTVSTVSYGKFSMPWAPQTTTNTVKFYSGPLLRDDSKNSMFLTDSRSVMLNTELMFLCIVVFNVITGPTVTFFISIHLFHFIHSHSVELWFIVRSPYSFGNTITAVFVNLESQFIYRCHYSFVTKQWVTVNSQSRPTCCVLTGTATANKNTIRLARLC